MKELIKAKVVAALKAAAQAAVTALLTALGLGAMQGCTTVVLPTANEEASSSTVSITGAIPFGFQFNTPNK